MKKINILLALLVGLVGLLIVSWPKPELELVFCDVGQGDAILIQYQNQQILVDTGPDSSVLSCLGRNMAFWDREIELVVITHTDKDHIGGLKAVEKRYRVDKLKVGEAGEIGLGNLKLTQIYPKSDSQVLGASNINIKNRDSVVLLGQYGEFDFLLTGDITEKEEVELAGLGPVEVLKVAHHGSKYSSGEGFLGRIRPRLAVISVGKNNYGHPANIVLERLKNVGAKVLRTDEAGEIKLVSDGKLWYLK